MRLPVKQRVQASQSLVRTRTQSLTVAVLRVAPSRGRMRVIPDGKAAERRRFLLCLRPCRWPRLRRPPVLSCRGLPGGKLPAVLCELLIRNPVAEFHLTPHRPRAPWFIRACFCFMLKLPLLILASLLGRWGERHPRDAQSVPYKLACPCDRLAGLVRSWHACLLFTGRGGVPIGLLGSCPYQVTLSTVTPDQSLPGVLRNEASKQKIRPGAPGTPPPLYPPRRDVFFVLWDVDLH